MNHKYVHSVEVLQAGIDIMGMEEGLDKLSDDVKKDFAIALLFHDIARAKELDPSTGEVIPQDHAVEGAKDVLALGIESLNVIIPIMVHNKINEAFVEVSDEELKERFDFKKLSKENKDFVLKLRRDLYSLSKEEQEIVMLGVLLVKDADKLANFQRFENMMGLMSAAISPKLNEEAKKQFFNGEVIDLRYRDTAADYAFNYLSWISDLNFKSSLEIINKMNILHKVKRCVLDMVKDCDEDEVLELSELLDEAIVFLLKKMF